MKKNTLALLILLAAGPLSAQETIRNPATPLNPYAGRTLALEPVFMFDDSAAEFSFKHPYEIHVDSRGCFYVNEFNPNQLWKFSPEGKFLGNLVKIGQGPGEIEGQGLASCVVWRDDVYLADGHSKIIRIDKDGRFIGELRTGLPRLFKLLAVSEDGYCVLRRNADWSKTGLIDEDNEVLFVSADGRTSQRVAGFITKLYREDTLRGTAATNWITFYSAVDPDGPTLYASHTMDYEIDKVDLAGRRALTSIAREYAWVRIPSSTSSKTQYNDETGFHPPPKDHPDDISGLYVCDKNLWVRTSTQVEGKGRLFDVFDPQGRYTDSLYLRGFEGHHLFPASGGFLYTLRQNADYVWTVRKFRILNGPKPSLPSRPGAALPSITPRSAEAPARGNR